MDRKRGIFLVFLLAYISFSFYSFYNRSQWLWDNVIAVFFLILVFYFSNQLRIGKTGLLLFNAALLAHNLGTFGFYSMTFGFIEYDNIVHFLGSVIAAFIMFNLIARRLHLEKKKFLKRTVVDEHKVMIIFLVIASVSMLGVFVELVEFVGYKYLGSGDGLFFVGAGDSGSDFPADASRQYSDTMGDIIINTIGSVFGSAVYYFRKYRKQCWLDSG